MESLTKQGNFEPDYTGEDEPQTVYFEFTPEFKILAGAMLVPAVAALVIYFLVAHAAGEVHAANSVVSFVCRWH